MDIYKLLKINKLIKNHRIKFLGLYLLHFFNKRYLAINLDPIMACNLRCKMCYFTDKEYLKTLKGNLTSELIQISELTDAFIKCDNLNNFEKLMVEHEQIVSKTIQLKTVQELLFADYFGQTKSLGAWGGDFILATGNEDTPDYFKQKGFETVIPYQDLIL